MSSDPVISASGFCAACGTVHSLGEGNSRKHALELVEHLETHKRIDVWRGSGLAAQVAARLSSPKSEAGDPPQNPFSTDYLWGEARGQMFGVLECADTDGNTVVLKAFSCQYDGEWLIDALSPDQFSRRNPPADERGVTLRCPA